ncbi:hypothetical protein E4U19_007644 [Claviceps sp. Clav32 group G5]|nr:hypothetical protein E4U19_007644 [Claviceps sp. Clav32 group G5]KAG6048100.1 hypothetical protein E4U39_007700 [Claviceps sp. Clav50 group G5]
MNVSDGSISDKTATTAYATRRYGYKPVRPLNTYSAECTAIRKTAKSHASIPTDKKKPLIWQRLEVEAMVPRSSSVAGKTTSHSDLSMSLSMSNRMRLHVSLSTNLRGAPCMSDGKVLVEIGRTTIRHQIGISTDTAWPAHKSLLESLYASRADLCRPRHV